jgi:hypothetical protein
MRTLAFISALLCLMGSVCEKARAQETAHTARDYFNELNSANAFNRYADEYVCFSDDSTPSFAVVSTGASIIERMKKNGDTNGPKALLKTKDYLFVKKYYKGVAGEQEIYAPTGTQESAYFVEFKEPLHGKMVYAINWVTGRYRLYVYALDHSRTVPASEASGKCELIHPWAQ